MNKRNAPLPETMGVRSTSRSPHDCPHTHGPGQGYSVLTQPMARLVVQAAGKVHVLAGHCPHANLTRAAVSAGHESVTPGQALSCHSLDQILPPPPSPPPPPQLVFALPRLAKPPHPTTTPSLFNRAIQIERGWRIPPRLTYIFLIKFGFAMKMVSNLFCEEMAVFTVIFMAILENT